MGRKLEFWALPRLFPGFSPGFAVNCYGCYYISGCSYLDDPLDHLSVVDDTSVTPLMEWFGVGETFTSTGPSYGPWALAKQRRIFG